MEAAEKTQHRLGKDVWKDGKAGKMSVMIFA
jgi:hypothetical protein